jgi:DNA polymerase sigma
MNGMSRCLIMVISNTLSKYDTHIPHKSKIMAVLTKHIIQKNINNITDKSNCIHKLHIKLSTYIYPGPDYDLLGPLG